MRLFSASFGCLMFVCALHCQAGDIETEIIYTGHDLHVFKGAGDRLQVAEAYPFPVPALGNGRVYDLSEPFARSGIELQPSELAIYSPESGRIYVRASSDRIDLARGNFQIHNCDPHPTVCSCTLEIRRFPKDGGSEEGIREEYWKFFSISGHRNEISLRDPDGHRPDRKLEFELTVGPDGETFYIVVVGDLPVSTPQYSVALDGEGTLGKPLTIFEGPASDGKSKIRATMLYSLYVPEDEKKRLQEFTPEGRQARAKLIEEDLKKALGNRGISGKLD